MGKARMNEMKWVFRQPPPMQAPAEWAQELSITPLLLQLLWRRGLREPEAMDSYLNASLEGLTPPAAWPQIPEAARLLTDELGQGKKLAVWGDYDADGITSTALVLEVLEAHGFTPLYHLPDRRKEGYGLNGEGLEQLAAQGCGILLTVDCGIGDVEAVRKARDLGMTVVVSDHHLPPDLLPPAHAIVNPRMPGSWPCSCLAGVGVAFFLMAALNIELAARGGSRYAMGRVLDLVALGTLADVMRLEGINRILTRAGLKRLEKTRRFGLAALKMAAGMDAAGVISSDQALFRLAPRINAAGRMGDPDLALRLLRARDFPSAEKLAAALDSRNQERKAEEKRIYEEAIVQAEQLLEDFNYAGLVLWGDDWHPGIVGIVASRIMERYNMPAFVLCSDGAILKGSGRSISDFDLNAALKQIGHCLLGYGGHKQAAGVRLVPENLAEFRRLFHEAAYAVRGDTPPVQELLLEGVLDFSKAANEEFLRELELMQPFGPGNEEPVFASPPLVVQKRSPLGRGGEHALLQVRDESTGVTLNAKGWRLADRLPASLTGSLIRLAYIPRLDVYNGLPRIDLEIKDWKTASL